MSKEFIKDIQREVFELIDKFPHLSADSAFVAWFMRAFITEDEKQAVDSLTGGAGDKSSDGIFFDHDNRIVFMVQGKYHQENKITESRSDVIALADLGRCLVIERKEAFDSVLNKANSIVQKLLIDARNYIHKRDYELHLHFVTTGQVSDTHENEAESRLEEFENVKFKVNSFNDLMTLMQDYVDGAAPPVPSISLPVQGNEVFKRPDKITGINSWIFTMAGKDIGNIYNDIGIRVFARNIRGFLGTNTEINKSIRHTIEMEPEYFWYYNNGITIVCDEAKQITKGNSNIIKVSNAQIINGQQTTRTLAIIDNNDAEVLVKLIEIARDRTDSKTKNQFKHVISEIVSATNWQNSISQSDLKSNDDEQVRIEKEFKKLGYYYIRKRMSKTEAVKYGANKFSFRVSKDELARAVTASTLDPYEVRLGKDRLFEDDIYLKIFNGKKAPEYLTFYWLFVYVIYWAKKEGKYSYVRWHALNLCWRLLEPQLKRPSVRERFRFMVERYKKYHKELLELDLIIKDVITLVKLYYRQNKNIDGSIQEPVDFFKHVNLHKLIYKFFDSNSNIKNKLERRLDKFTATLKTESDE